MRVKVLLGPVVLALGLALAGCGRLKPVTLVGPGVSVPEHKAVVFFVDGVRWEVFNEMLAGGELPAIERYLVRRGVRVENAVTAAPSITYAVNTTLATGLAPGHHGVLGNRYFDPYRAMFVDYTTTKTYRDVDEDYRAETIYEILDEHFSVTIQTPVRRGVYRKIDNWASSGLRWFFGQIPEIDALTAERFELIEDVARRARRWPGLIMAYFPATDEMGHRYGPDSEQYRESVRNADEQIGRICAALEASGLLETTYLWFVTDHGMAACPKEKYLDVAAVVRQESGLRVATAGPGRDVHFSKRAAYFEAYEAVVANGGYRRVGVYLRQGEHWGERAAVERVRPLADRLGGEAAVAVAAYPDGEAVVVQNALGRGLIEAEAAGACLSLDEQRYRYRVIDGADPLGYDAALAGSTLLDGQYHSGREWLAATAATEYPDAVVQLAELFDSRRAGDLVLFAADGWDFAPEAVGGHGSVVAADMRVPMVIAGPLIRPGGTLPTARTVDVAVTLIDMLEPAALTGRYFDGRSLLGELQ